jgi:hypothetical protein
MLATALRIEGKPVKMTSKEAETRRTLKTGYSFISITLGCIEEMK